MSTYKVITVAESKYKILRMNITDLIRIPFSDISEFPQSGATDYQVITWLDSSNSWVPLSLAAATSHSGLQDLTANDHPQYLNVQSDWSALSGDAFILNKPSALSF